jgi:hypothetical protein
MLHLFSLVARCPTRDRVRDEMDRYVDSKTELKLRTTGTAVVVAVVAVAALVWTLSISRRSVAFAFAINWALMGLAFVVWLVVPIRFGRGYSRVHRFERSGRLYESLGVRVFQRFLRRSGLHGPSVFPRYVAGSGGGATLVAATYGPETAHLLIFVVLAAVATDFAWRGWWDTAGWLSLFNILHNAYPVLSLRYVRVRADRIFRSAFARSGYVVIQQRERT